MTNPRKDCISRWGGRLSLAAGFALWFALNPSNTVLAQLDNVYWAPDFERILGRLNTNKSFDERDGVSGYPEQRILSGNNVNRISQALKVQAGVSQPLPIGVSHQPWFWIAPSKLIANQCYIDCPIYVFSPYKPKGNERIGNLRRLMIVEEYASKNWIKLRQAIKNELIWIIFHRLENNGLSGGIEINQNSNTTYAYNFVAASGDLTGSITHPNATERSAIGTEISDTVSRDKNDCRSVAKLSEGRADTNQTGPKYFVERRDPMLGTGVIYGGAGATWLVYGHDIDVSWDGETWYHLLGARCIKNLERIDIQIPDKR